MEQLIYHVHVSFEHNGSTILDKLIAAFYIEDDAYSFAHEVLNRYNDLGDKCVVVVKRDGSITNRLYN